MSLTAGCNPTPLVRSRAGPPDLALCGTGRSGRTRWRRKGVRAMSADETLALGDRAERVVRIAQVIMPRMVR
jgi:hypothetical protein